MRKPCEEIGGETTPERDKGAVTEWVEGSITFERDTGNNIGGGMLVVSYSFVDT